MQGEGAAFTLVRCGSDEEWLGERRKGVGGSDVAAIMGLSPWRSPYEVWAEKVSGTSEDISGRPAVIWGNVLEPVVGAHYAQGHLERLVRRVHGMCRSVARPWAQASLDFEVRDPELGWGVLEIKTAGARSSRDWDEGVPLHYQTQVAHYLSVTDRPFADVAVLIGGQDYREYRIMRDPGDERAVNDAVDRFWNDNVLAGVPPAVMRHDAPGLIGEHPEGDGIATADATPDLFVRYLRARRDLDATRDEVADLGAQVRDAIGDLSGVRTPDGTMTWVRRRVRRYDYEALDRDHPGLRDGYSSESVTDGGLRWRPARKEK